MSNTQATAAPRRAASRRELHTDDVKIEQPSPIVMPGLNEILVREPEEIAAIDSPMESDYTKELMFMDEPVTIRIEQSSEKNAAKIIDVYVNGRPEWIPVGKPWTVARKYVEVLARAKPIDVQTSHESAEQAQGGDPVNKILRTVRTLHPFSIVADANPRGVEWFNRLLTEG